MRIVESTEEPTTFPIKEVVVYSIDGNNIIGRFAGGRLVRARGLVKYLYVSATWPERRSEERCLVICDDVAETSSSLRTGAQARVQFRLADQAVWQRAKGVVREVNPDKGSGSITIELQEPPESVSICGAETKKGTPCQRPAGWGTDHPSVGACRQHERSSL